MDKKLNLKIVLIIYVLISLLILLILPIKYKYYWAFLYPLVLIKGNKFAFIFIMFISLLITPSFIYLRINDMDQVMRPDNAKIKLLLKNKNIEQFYMGNNNLIYARNICYFYYNDCEYKYINDNMSRHLKQNQANYNFIEGNISNLNYNLRTKYKFNNYLSNLDFRNKTFYIPKSYEEQIIYNYGFNKEAALSSINHNINKCELLLYGAQNKWNSYKNTLISELHNDQNNKCIDNIERNNIGYKELTIEEKNIDKEKLIKFLNNLNY